MLKFLDKLNSLKILIVVLTLVLAVNGFLLYSQSSPPETTAPPGSGENAAAPADPAPETAGRTDENEEAGEPGPPQDEEAREPAEEQAPSRPEPREEEPAVEEAAVEEPVREEPAGVDLGGMGRAMRGCGLEGDECVRAFVSEAAPEARYVGGGTDLETGRDDDVLYFEDPTLGECEHVRKEHAAGGGTTYTVIVVGEGSFDSARGPGCVPTA